MKLSEKKRADLNINILKMLDIISKQKALNTVNTKDLK